MGQESIIGTYLVAKAFTPVGGELGLFTREEVEADFDAKVASGEAEPEERADALQAFDTKVEFTPDHRVVTWMKLPADISEEELKEAIEAGEIGEVKDGYFAAEEKEWKEEDGKFLYDTGEYREMFGEVKSPWDEITFDEDGLMNFGDGMAKLERI